MTYEGQVAGVARRRARPARASRWSYGGSRRVDDPAGGPPRPRSPRASRELAELEFWNAGGSGSVEATAADPVVTEVAAGSGLLVPALFDHYRAFTPRPAAYFGVPGAPPPHAGDGHRRTAAASSPRAPPAPTGCRAVGTRRPAPDRARGRRRGADPAHRAGRREAADRRPGVVPARQVRRAVRARQDGVHLLAGDRFVDDGADLPRPRARRSDEHAATHWSLDLRRSPAADARSRAGWSAIDGPAGSGKTTLAAAVAVGARRPGACTWTTSTRAGTASPTRRPGSATGSCVRWPTGSRGATGATTGTRKRSPRRVTVEPVRPAGPRGRGLRVAASRRPDRPPWSGSRRRRPAAARGLERDGEAVRAAGWEAWVEAEQALFTAHGTRQRADLRRRRRPG